MDNNIIIHDNYKIFDSLVRQRKESAAPCGWVRIFMNKKLVHEGSNLVVAQGRSFVAQRIFGRRTASLSGGQDSTDGTESGEQWYNSYITHFAIGSGGAETTEDVVEIHGPDICDVQLAEPIDLGATAGYLNEYIDGTETYCIKPISESGGGIEFNSRLFGDPTGDNCTRYSTVLCKCIIPAGEPTSLGPGESVEISEAGLYFTLYTGGAYTRPRLFARVTFAPKWKEPEGELELDWYIIC